MLAQEQRPSAYRLLIAVTWACLLAAWTTSVALAHPFHITTADATLNRTTQSLEVSLELSPIELERAIALRFNVDLDVDDKEAEAVIARYATEAFKVEQAGIPAVLQWVGMELDITTGWLYFEFADVKDDAPLTIENRFLVEVAEAADSQQLNTVRFSLARAAAAASQSSAATSRGSGRVQAKRTLTFTAPDYRQRIDPALSSN